MQDTIACCINQSISATPFTFNYTNSASGTTFGGGSIKKVEYIDFSGGTGNDNINTSAATYSVLYSGVDNDTLTISTGMIISMVKQVVILS